jgi:type IV pilus assembly protein PilA
MKDVRKEFGFTLIELLVVILIIGVLAAIAIPIFLKQREKSYVAQTQHTLKNAATTAESYATETDGNYSGLDNDDGTLLRLQGFKGSAGVTVSVAATPSEYCITATHSRLDVGDPWKISTYNSDDGSPSPIDADACP